MTCRVGDLDEAVPGVIDVLVLGGPGGGRRPFGQVAALEGRQAVADIIMAFLYKHSISLQPKQPLQPVQSCSF